MLDPFCGTGTTGVECKKRGFRSVGVEAHPLAHFAARVKVDWNPDPDGLIEHAEQIAQAVSERLESEGVRDTPGLSRPRRRLRTLPPEAHALLLTDSISPLPLHKTLVLLDCLETYEDERYAAHERLALAKALIQAIGNLRFGPEVGVAPAKDDAAVLAPWLEGVSAIAADLRKANGDVATEVHLGDSRKSLGSLRDHSVAAVITSPPYPNEKDYTRTTRLESVLLGFVRDKHELQALKRGLVRSNTRNVYKGDDDHEWIAQHPEIETIARAIEARRVRLGKTSGFEKNYAKVTRLYFGGMARHLSELRRALRPDARLAYVVGDQASYLRVMIRTGQLIAKIAEPLGYEVVGIDLFRTRLATATRKQLREEVVVLRWPG